MRRKLVLAIASLIIGGISFTQTKAQSTCSPPPVQSNSKSLNFFSPEQEMILGELTFQRMSGDLRFIRDPQLTAYINRIGEELVKHLPPTGLKFQFHIVDIPEANAFNIPGGYVFVSRKLIAFANSENELVGVLAHELGHAVVRHGASDFSELLKKTLNVAEVGDRRDIAEKYNLFLEKWRTRPSARRSGHESDQQQEADRIGLFAMTAAGYDANAFSTFFDRLVETKGKTGSWFTDIFGKAKPEQKRLREMIKVAGQLPPQCRENRRAEDSQQFLKWQADVVSYRDAGRKEELPALLWKKSLAPRLRGDFSHFAFSPDGKYFLAQDDFAITVVQREPLEIAFQIPAAEAKEATFTPDAQHVVFGTEKLRYEKWSLAEKKAVEVRELVVRRDCWEHEFSPDGKFLACVDNSLNVNLLETQTGKKVWEKKEFYRLNFFELLGWLAAKGDDDDIDRRRFFHIEFSPDSRFLAISRSNKFRFTFSIDGIAGLQSEDTLLAMDLSTLKPVSVGGELKRITRRPFVFLDSNRILGMSSRKTDESGIFSFPDGKRVSKLTLGGEELKLTSNPNYVVVKPLANAQMGVVDLARGSIIGGYNKLDAAFWNNLMVKENRAGQVVLSEVRYDEEKKLILSKDIASIEIPVGSLGRLYAATISDNFQWLAVSSKSRGAVWDVASGDRKQYVRGFRGVAIGNNGLAVGDFPKLEPVNHSLVVLDPSKNSVEPLREIPEKGARQYGRFVLLRRSLRAVNKKEEEELKANLDNEDKASDFPLTREVRFELVDIINNKVVWSQDFPKEAPHFFFDEFSGRVIFYWTLGSFAGKAMLKENPTLAARAQALGNRDEDYLMEIVDAFAGKIVGTFLIETGKGSFDINSGFSEGNWVVLSDSNNRVLVYSIKDGELHHRFFGAQAAINPSKNQILVENYPGELSFYDLGSGDSQARLVFSSDTAFIRFSLDGKRLFVLSDEQMAYAFDVEKIVMKPAPPAQ